MRPKGNGVVLTANVSKRQIVNSPSLKSVQLKQDPARFVNESEVLVQGKLTGEEVKAGLDYIKSLNKK